MRIRERFNPRAPCGARPPTGRAATGAVRFQPTRPLRGATRDHVELFGIDPISTHAPLAGRDCLRPSLICATLTFQPTRPLRGATLWIGSAIRFSSFQPTRPLRGATCASAFSICGIEIISTHAPLAGRDTTEILRACISVTFQPTRPLRGATNFPNPPVSPSRFQPTRPLRGATRRNSPFLSILRFQPTRPLRGATGGVVQW